MSKQQLINIAQQCLRYAENGTIEQAEQLFTVPAANYTDEERSQLEYKQVFRRLPLMLATSAELPNNGDYKAITAGDVPVLITRTPTGEIKAYLNSCSHRGAQIMLDGSGNSKRFTCPYHAWSYNHEGELLNVYAAKDYGEVDKSCNSLVSLPCLEDAGLIWVILDNHSALDIKTFLCGYDAMLAHFNFADWHVLGSQQAAGPNWKIAYDGYLDFYHLPVLHKDTFGNTFANQALYYSYGPHQRVISPALMQSYLADKPEHEWDNPFLINGVWTIFPHTSIASLNEDTNHTVLISQLFPGKTASESITIQTLLCANKPDDEVLAAGTEQLKFFKYVVVEEDYATGFRQQQVLRTGLKDNVQFGRNELGGHNFHQWLDKIIACDTDQKLNELFSQHSQQTKDN